MSTQILVYAILSVLWATTAYAALTPMGKPRGEQHEPLEQEEVASQTLQE